MMNPEDMSFLRDLTLAAIRSATLPAAATFMGKIPPNSGFTSPVNRLGFDAVRPGGRDCYPAIWIQDFTMSYSSGLIPPVLGQRHLECIAATQNGPVARLLQSPGARVPPWAIADHINLDGGGVFFPGTYSSGDDQGGEPYGLQPPACNFFDFIWLAWLRWHEEGAPSDYLTAEYAGVPLLDRLKHAFAAVETDPANGLVQTCAERRFVGFIFCDSVYMTGHLLFASLERYRAAGQLAEMCSALGQREATQAYAAEAHRIARSVPEVFAAPRTHGGWLKASTGVSGQADVWGTFYALFLDLLPASVKEAALAQIRTALQAGTIEFQGALRHIPTDRDASPESAWERAMTARNVYQNGAYWHTPTGWGIHVLSQTDPAAAEGLWDRYLAALRAEDFRQGENFHAPWENIGLNSASFQNPVFLPSVTLPFSVLSDPKRHQNPYMNH
jgi:hypothetical protein